MSVYRYTGRHQDGTPEAGTLEAESRAQATVLLRKQGLWIETLAAEGALEQASEECQKAHWSVLYGLRPISAGGMSNFFAQLGALFRAGVPMQTVVEHTAERVSNRRLAHALREMSPRLGAGKSLSECMGEYPQVFPRSAAGMMRVGELTGNLDELAKDLAEDYAGEQRVGLLLLIPKIYFGLFGLVAMLVPSIVWVITKGLAWWPQYALRNIVPWLAVLILLLMVWRIVWHLPGFRRTKDRLAYYTPVWSLLTRRAGMTRFFRSMEIAVRAGVDFPTALNAAAEAAGNEVMIAQLREAETKVRGGQPLEQALAVCRFLPRDKLGMLGTAGLSGAFDQILPLLAQESRASRDNTVRLMRMGGLAVVYVIAAVVTVVIAYHGYSAIFNQYIDLTDEMAGE